DRPQQHPARTIAGDDKAADQTPFAVAHHAAQRQVHQPVRAWRVGEDLAKGDSGCSACIEVCRVRGRRRGERERGVPLAGFEREGAVPVRGGCKSGSQVRRDVPVVVRSEEHTSELQSRENLVCRLLLEKKKNTGTIGKCKRGILEPNEQAGKTYADSRRKLSHGA